MSYNKYMNNITLGDCCELMKNIPDYYISGCITSPIYNYEFFGRNSDNVEIERRKNKANINNNILVKTYHTVAYWLVE